MTGGTFGQEPNHDRSVPIHLPREPLILAWWRDPDFYPAESAVYCVRVLEIPTPPWLAYDKAFFGDTIDLPDGAVTVQQERAYTSPIWYAPE